MDYETMPDETEGKKIARQTIAEIDEEKNGPPQTEPETTSSSDSSPKETTPTQDSKPQVSRPRNPASSKELAEAAGTAADNSEVLIELLEGRETGGQSETEKWMEMIAGFMESFDERLARIEDHLMIYDDLGEPPHPEDGE